jgi:hypothetical protein
LKCQEINGFACSSAPIWHIELDFGGGKKLRTIILNAAGEAPEGERPIVASLREVIGAGREASSLA